MAVAQIFDAGVTTILVCWSRARWDQSIVGTAEIGGETFGKQLLELQLLLRWPRTALGNQP